MHRPFLFFLLLFIDLSLFADHLELRRNAGVKAGPESQASVIYQGSSGELFSLLDNGQQTNGYYHVAIPGGSSGWIYRSIVRLHHGDLPNQEGIKTKAIEIFGIGQIPVDYYSTAAGLVGEELKNHLHLIVRNHDVITYDEAWEALTETDKDPGTRRM